MGLVTLLLQDCVGPQACMQQGSHAVLHCLIYGSPLVLRLRLLHAADAAAAARQLLLRWLWQLLQCPAAMSCQLCHAQAPCCCRQRVHMSCLAMLGPSNAMLRGLSSCRGLSARQVAAQSFLLLLSCCYTSPTFQAWPCPCCTVS
jgi:hypothetical protein